MALNNYNLNKLLSRSKHIISQVRKAKLDLTSQHQHQLSQNKSTSKFQRPARKTPIFKLASSKGFSQNPNKQLRINTLPDYIDDGWDIGPDYQTPKFSAAYTVKIPNQQKLEDMFSTFGFHKKLKTTEKTQKSIKAKGKQNRDYSEHRLNKEDIKDKDKVKQQKQVKQVKESKRKFLSTLNFGAKKEKSKVNFASKRIS